MEEKQKVFPNRKYAKGEEEAAEGASHGLTKGQMQDVYNAQRQGQEVPMISANCDSKYMIKAYEQHMFHARIKIPQFDPSSGEDTSLVKEQSFNPAMFAANEKSGAWDGRVVTILHDPNKVLHFAEDGKFTKKPKAKIRGFE